MNLEEFKNSTEPRARRSRLQPYLKEILDLKKSGYTNLQISEWLQIKGIEITQESVRKFVLRREKQAAENLLPSDPGELKEPGPDTKPAQEARQATKQPTLDVSKMKTLLNTPTDLSEFE